MRKANLLPLSILLALLLLTLWNSAAITRASTRWQLQLESAAALAQAGNWPAASTTLQECYTDWSARQRWLHIVTQHTSVDNAEAMYRRAMAFAMTEESSEFQAELSDLRSQIRTLTEMEQLRIENIL